MQQSNTRNMIFSVRELISFVSQDTTLLPGAPRAAVVAAQPWPPDRPHVTCPGTVLLTGTPAGVGYARRPPLFLAAGDVVEVAIAGLGRLVSPVAAPAPA